MRALEATGLLPEHGVMWGCVPLQLNTPLHSDKLLASLSLGARAVSPRVATGAGAPNLSARSHASAAAHVEPDVADVPDIENAGGPCAAGGAKDWSVVHACAVQNGEKFYEDPETKLMVMTELVHLSRATCCGKACRHCPFMHDRVSVRARAQQISRPAWLAPPPALSAPSVPGVPKGAIGVSNGLTSSISNSNSMHAGDTNGAASAATQNRMGAATLREQPTVATGVSGVSTGAALSSEHAGVAPADVAVLLCGCSDSDLEKAQARQAAGALVVLVAPLGAETRTVVGTDMHAKHACERAVAAGLPLVGVPVHEGGPGHVELLREALRVVLTAVEGDGAVRFTEIRESLGAAAGDWQAAADSL